MLDPKILVFDTTTVACTVAVKSANGVFSKHVEKANIHSQKLLEMIDELLIDAELELAQLDFIAVGVGPGSFTGLRIGIGVAQALAYSNEIALLPVSSLEMIAVNALDEASSIKQNATESKHIIVAHDARMGEIYSAVYECSNRKRLQLIEPIRLTSPESLQISLGYVANNDELIYCGNGWHEYSQQLSHINFNNEQLIDVETPIAEKVVSYVDQFISQFSSIKWTDLQAEYVRNDVAKKSQKK